ncbi:hypothetical protein [Glycomyces salinus]|uniref:hypothetical protein n=1 Tax=Glycomyces salinus TaxID=980294 RepID=UPI0018EBE673|nr:hypothetical protein [Glycomyces salinus]
MYTEEMMEHNQSLWDEIDLPLLRLVVAWYDEHGPFEADDLRDSSKIELSPQEFAYASKRLAVAGHIDVRSRAGGFPHSVEGIAPSARRLVSGSPSPHIGAYLPRLEDLGPQLGESLAKAAQALRADPNHSDAPRWRTLLAAAADTGIDFGPEFAAEAARGRSAAPPAG